MSNKYLTPLRSMSLLCNDYSKYKLIKLTSELLSNRRKQTLKRTVQIALVLQKILTLVTVQCACCKLCRYGYLC